MRYRKSENIESPDKLTLLKGFNIVHIAPHKKGCFKLVVLILTLFLIPLSCLSESRQSEVKPSKGAEAIFLNLKKEYSDLPQGAKLYVSKHKTKTIIAIPYGNNGVIISSVMNKFADNNYKTNRIAAAISVALAELIKHSNKKYNLQTYSPKVAIGYWKAKEAGYNMCAVEKYWARAAYRKGFAHKYYKDATIGVMYGAAKAACENDVDQSFQIGMGV